MFCQKRNREKYKDHFEVGIYVCVKCANELFLAESKFKHDSEWPAFSRPIRENSVRKEVEMEGIYKLFCSQCGNDIGHEFLGDGPHGLSRF